MEGYRYVHLSLQERVALLQIDHPPVNALDNATLVDIAAAFEQALADGEAKVIVIAGTARSFVAGADIHDLAAMATVEDALAKAQQGQRLCDQIERAPKPVIAAITGRYCLGGGNELAMACHIRIAEAGVRFGQPEIKLGLIPGWGASQRLVRLVGLGNALELILTGDQITADQAQRLGLVNRVVPDGGALEEAMGLARQIAVLSSQALRRALDSVYTGLERGPGDGLAHEAQCFAQMAATRDMHEGLAAFLEKRPPDFRDE